MAVPASCAAGKNNPSVSFADSSLYTREPWALPRQYITQANPDYDLASVKSAVIANQSADWRTPGWPLLPRTQPSSLHVIANQSADWCGNPYPCLRGNSPSGNPFPLMQSIFSVILGKVRRFGYGLPRRFAPRNDSAGRNSVIKIRMLTKTDSHNFDFPRRN